ncbi:MAG: PPP family 3-phenylpropionic acid transporter [Kiritimatiellia bacterium]
MRLAVGPAWGVLADARGDVRSTLIQTSALVVAGVVMLQVLPVELALVGAWMLAVGRAGSAPLVDAASVYAVRHDPSRYGLLRRWGSLGFLILVPVAGWARETWGLSPLWLGVGLGVALTAMSATMPRTAAPPKVRLGPALRRLLGDRGVMLLFLASSLHFAGHSIYDMFFALHIQASGGGTTLAGAAVALGVGVEIVLLSFSGRLLRSLGPRTLLLGSMALSIPRWLLTAWVTDPMVAVGVQALHGVTFGAFWIAAMDIVRRRTPVVLGNSGIALLAAAVGGLGAALGNLVGTLVLHGESTWPLFIGAAVLASLATASGIFCVVALRRPPPQQQDPATTSQGLTTSSASISR